MKPTDAFFWRRLDAPGHDSCRLFRAQGGWQLSGAAVFFEAGRPCHFQYQVVVDDAWITRRADVVGYLGKRAIDLHILSTGNACWTLDGCVCDEVAGCIDLDLGFTPATNLIPIRRLSLHVGERAEAPAAYLEFPRMRLVRLAQNYQRTGARSYAYESPQHGYSAVLQVTRCGAVASYPGVFERVVAG